MTRRELWWEMIARGEGGGGGWEDVNSILNTSFFFYLLQLFRGFLNWKNHVKKNGQVPNKPQIRLAVAKNSWRYLFANPNKTLVRVASVSNRVIAQEGAATANLKWNGEGEGRRGHACPQTPWSFPPLPSSCLPHYYFLLSAPLSRRSRAGIRIYVYFRYFYSWYNYEKSCKPTRFDS